MAFPKWMYRNSSEVGYQSTLVQDEAIEKELTAAGFGEDPKSFGVDVVPYPCELTPAGVLQHHAGIGQDANGNYAYGPRPTVAGIGGAQVLKG
jgi:hypothetical protein